ncbi:MAG: hypothetical protein PWP23_3048 [Candidatus Sumerlaeota bacterium]|nr:hypothetical protein [Candidatus Sumerlaeota bacterium]
MGVSVLGAMRATLLIVALAALSGCGAARNEPSLGAAPLHLYLRLDTTTPQPGEAIIAEVLLLNAGEEDLKATPLNHESVTFWLHGGASPSGTEVLPVFSEKEPVKEARELGRDEMWARRFVLTRPAMEPGAFALQATYSSDPARMIGRTENAASRIVEFVVTGETLLKRDGDGVILKEEAIRIAREAMGLEGEAEARLIVNEAGFLDWMVKLGEGEGQKAVLVNPYLGKVRREMEPALFPRRDEDPGPRVFPRRAE